ncbi:MAG: UDP-N-acetylmuramoyl-tripeptide--D-alanyl-D-alanine ligase [Treponema sp.]|nr:UDP-N-acetylmuramoyl-tripeptide--D-alanyl-D-alanine ligase [Treponema sp.]
MNDSSHLMSLLELSRAVGGRLLSGGEEQPPRTPPASLQSAGFFSVCIDSRAAKSGALFVALRGAEQDGHRFVQAAFDRGAVAALVDFRALEDSSLGLAAVAQSRNCVLVAVDDTLKALQSAAAAYLARFPKLVRIGITGSSGKTTTKEIAAAIIRQEKQVVMNEGNLNSETGLPLAVFNVREHHEIGIFEVAMNNPGEIAPLARVLKPHIVLITNIGVAHIGQLGSRDAIALEKKQVFSYFDGSNTALIPAEDDYRDFLAEGIAGRAVFYGEHSLADLRGVKDMGLEGTEINWNGQSVRLRLPGKFNRANAFAAISLAQELGVSSQSVCKGLESVQALFGRGEILRGRTTLLRDCYNSNPASAAAAVEFCDSLEWKEGRRVYIVGSMLELGEMAEREHATLGKQLASCKADMLFLYGKEMQAAAAVLKNGAIPCFHTAAIDDLSRAVDAYIQRGDLVLLKGSRGVALEVLTDILVEGGGA